MNIDKYANMNREEFIDFLNIDYLIPIDDTIEYKGKKYKLNEDNFYSYLACHRAYENYSADYNKPATKEIIKQINNGTLSGICSLSHLLDNYLERNCIKELEPEIKEVV